LAQTAHRGSTYCIYIYIYIYKYDRIHAVLCVYNCGQPHECVCVLLCAAQEVILTQCNARVDRAICANYSVQCTSWSCNLCKLLCAMHKLILQFVQFTLCNARVDRAICAIYSVQCKSWSCSTRSDQIIRIRAVQWHRQSHFVLRLRYNSIQFIKFPTKCLCLHSSQW